MPKKKSIVFTFGRFQPPTIGHEKLIGAVMAHAKSMGGEHRIYASQTTDPKKNPLTHDQKIGFMRDMFPKANIIKGDSKTKTFMEVLYQLQNEGYETVHMMVGDDRVSEMETTVKRYLNGKNQDTALNFKEFKVVSAGKRDPDAVGVEGMSASKMRAAVAAGNFAAFQSGLPKGFKRGKELFKTLQKGMEAMKPKKKKTVKENAEMINEVTPPDEKAERLVKKRKGDFKKRYGEDWASYLYGVAWKQYNKRHGIKTKTRLGEPIEEESILDILFMLEATIPAYAWVKEINREKKTATLQWTDDNGDPVEEEVPMDEIPGFFAGASKPLRTRKTDKFGNLLSKMGKINPKKIGATAQQNQQTATELKDLIDGKPMGTVITIYGKKYGKKDDHTVNLMKRRLMGREIYVLKSTGKEVELNITGAGLQVVDAKSKRILLDKGNDATW